MSNGLVTCSVVVCAFNPRMDHLTRVLQSLRDQDLPVHKWELIVVDNNSDVPLNTLLDLSWHPQGRFLIERKAGLVRARLAGGRCSTANLVIFVDDDNELSSNYLSTALTIAERFPFLGAFGGSCIGDYECDVPAALIPFLGLLAIRVVERAQWANVDSCSTAMPRGAGLCVRREVLEAYREVVDSSPLRASLDRTGTSLASSGDVDLVCSSCTIGLGFGVFPELSLRHLISRERLDSSYLIRLAEGIGYSTQMRKRLNGFEVRERAWLAIVKQTVKRLLISLPSRFVSIDFRISAAYDRGAAKANRDFKKLDLARP